MKPIDYVDAPDHLKQAYQVALRDSPAYAGSAASRWQYFCAGYSAAQAAPAENVEPMVRYCPECGSVGPIQASYRDCCPDGSAARMIPEKLAIKSRDTFMRAIKIPVALPEVVEASDEDEESSENCWRRLAMQFDNHRMQALGHLRVLLKHPVTHAQAATSFLAAGPLDGETVLAQRLAVLAQANGSDS